VLHATRHDHELRAGDLLLADVGAETPEGWAGDVTRTWPVTGRFSATQRALYEVVLAAQLAAIDAVRPGVRYAEVHRIAGRVVVEGLVALGILIGDPAELAARGAAALFFPHGVGHLIGLDVHDMEDLGDRAGYAPGRERSDRPGERYLRLDRDLVPGMAVTIEPGYYRIPHILERAEEVGDLEANLNRAVLAQFADVRGIRIEDDVLVTEHGCDVLTRAIPKSVEEVEAAIGA
jgi:Xaa-Pro aminopeptidase